MTHFTDRSGEGGWGAARADLTGSVPDPAARTLAWGAVDRPMLVVGPADQPPADQPPADRTPADQPPADRTAIDRTRRRSGGGPVLLLPGCQVWLDVVIPRGDPLWHDDIGVAPLWLGRAWAAALEDLGVEHPTVHTGPMRAGPVCFAGVGPGEVLVGGRKVVGISQRRTRAGALFQVAVLQRWAAEETAAATGVDAAAIAGGAVGIDELVGRSVPEDEIRAAFLRHLP